MNGKGKAAGVGSVSGGEQDGSRPQHTTPPPSRQAPSGTSPAQLKGDLIIIEGRHVAAVRNGELRRSFDATRELLRGFLFFRLDVLALAERAGARWIIVTERGSKQDYRISLADFRAHGWCYCHPKFGEQIGLSLGDFERIVPGAPRVRQLVLMEIEL